MSTEENIFSQFLADVDKALSGLSDDIGELISSSANEPQAPPPTTYLHGPAFGKSGLLKPPAGATAAPPPRNLNPGLTTTGHPVPNARPATPRPLQATPGWKGMRGFLRYLWKGQSQDNPDYYPTREHMSLKQYNIINDIITNEFVVFQNTVLLENVGLNAQTELANLLSKFRQFIMNSFIKHINIYKDTLTAKASEPVKAPEAKPEPVVEPAAKVEPKVEPTVATAAKVEPTVVKAPAAKGKAKKTTAAGTRPIKPKTKKTKSEKKLRVPDEVPDLDLTDDELVAAAKELYNSDLTPAEARRFLAKVKANESVWDFGKRVDGIIEGMTVSEKTEYYKTLLQSGDNKFLSYLDAKKLKPFERLEMYRKLKSKND